MFPPIFLPTCIFNICPQRVRFLPTKALGTISIKLISRFHSHEIKFINCIILKDKVSPPTPPPLFVHMDMAWEENKGHCCIKSNENLENFTDMVCHVGFIHSSGQSHVQSYPYRCQINHMSNLIPADARAVPCLLSSLHMSGQHVYSLPCRCQGSHMPIFFPKYVRAVTCLFSSLHVRAIPCLISSLQMPGQSHAFFRTDVRAVP